MKWIKYKDQRPPKEGRYLCSNGAGSLGIGIYRTNHSSRPYGEWLDDGCCGMEFNAPPTYWCELDEIETPKD